MAKNKLKIKLKNIKEETAKFRIEASFFYIEKYLDKQEKYEYLKNPYNSSNKCLKKWTDNLNRTTKLLITLFPREKKFIDEIHYELWDIYEEILEEQSLVKAKRNYNPVRINLLCLFQLLKKNINSDKNPLAYLTYTDTRLKELAGKISKARKNLINLFIVTYLVHYRKLSTEYLKDKKFISDLESYLEQNCVSAKNILKSPLRLISKIISVNLDSLHSFRSGRVKFLNSTLVTLFNNISLFYNLFLSVRLENGESTPQFPKYGAIQTYSTILNYEKNKQIEGIIRSLSILISEFGISLNYISRIRRNVSSICSKLNY